MFLRLFFCSLLGSACAACGANGPVDAGHDSGADSGVDSGRDAGIDAGTDAGSDSGALDGGMGSAGWVPMPGVPERCPVLRALRPEALYRSEWAPCPEQPIGCLRETNTHVYKYAAAGWFDGERGYTWVGNGGVVALVDMAGAAVAAWWVVDPVGDGHVCIPHVAVGDGYAALYLAYINNRVEGQDWAAFYHAPIREIGALTEPTVVLEEGLPSQPQRMAVSAGVVAAEIQPGGFNIVFSGGRWRALWGEPVVGTPQRVMAAGEFAYWEDWQDLQRIAFGSLGQDADWLYRADPAQIRKLNTDGVSLAWTQLSFDPDPRTELWTAPVVSSVDAFVPRMVRTMDEQPAVTAMGDGWFATLYADPQRLLLVELATGRTKTWIAPPNWGITIHDDAPNYVSGVEIGLHVRDSDRNDFFVRLDPRTIPWDE